uniref:Uncharacterized protein n=1 Tax=Lepeophtheirus salmonis TaxID=72036 RepID=A0A0K2U509_LEPSM
MALLCTACQLSKTLLLSFIFVMPPFDKR